MHNHDERSLYRDMFMLKLSLLGLVFAFSLTAISEAQQIQVRKKPVPQHGQGEYVEYDQWTVSYSRKNGPGVFELDTVCKTEQQARQRAQKLIAWSNSMDANSDWRLAVILIEGEPSVKGKTEELKKSAEEGKKAFDYLKEAKEAIDKAKEVKEKGLTAEERKLGDTLKEYTDRIKDTYENVKNLKSNMLSMTGKISRKQFDEANKLIASYNKSRDELGKVEQQFSA